MICRMTMDAFKSSDKRIDPRLPVRLVKAYSLWKVPAAERRFINGFLINSWPGNISGQSMKSITQTMPDLTGSVVDCPVSHMTFIALLAEPAKAYDAARKKKPVYVNHDDLILPYSAIRPARVEQVEGYYVSDVMALCDRIRELEGLIK